MSSKIASLLALCVLVSVCAASHSQSLGELAKKERERREKNKDNGVTVLEFSETEIFDDDEEEEGDVDDAGVEGESKSVAVEPDDDSERVEEESRDRKLQEAEWRNRFHDARERVAFAREQKEVWDGVYYVEGVKLVDENGNVVVESLDDLRRFVEEASQELTDAERALRNLGEEARRAGVPPGWLR